jgi:hypothetical protein
VAFPTVLTENGGTNTTPGTSHDINLPASIAAGDLLLAAIATDRSSTTTWPAGWTELDDGLNSASTNALSIAYRIADGTEGSTVTVTTSASGATAHRSWRIAGHDPGTPPEVAAQGGLASVNPNPPVLNPGAWAVEDTLWFALASWRAGATVSAYPSGYGSGVSSVAASGGGSNGVGVAGARDINTTSQVNPPTYTISSSNAWRAATVGVRPRTQIVGVI